MDRAAGTESARDAPLVLVSSVEGEQHARAARTVAEALCRAGWQVHYAGDAPDPGDLVPQVLALDPHAVCLSASLRSTRADVEPLLTSLRSLGVPVVVVAGRAVGGDPEQALSLGATAYAADPRAAVEIIRSLPRRAGVTRPAPGASGPRHDDEAAWIVEHLPALASATLGVLDAAAPAGGPGREALAAHARHLLGSLAAALVAEEVAIVVETRDWLAETLAGYGAGGETVLDGLWAGAGRVLRGRPLARVLLEEAARDDEQDEASA